MSLSSQASLGGLRIQAKQRASMENNPFISDPEWNSYITNSYKELYDLLVAAYGNDYFVSTPFQFSISGSSALYPLPSNFYKLLGVDLQFSGSTTGWISLKRFEFLDRNKANYLNSAFTISSLAQAWYIPQPTALQLMPICATTLASTTVTVSNTTDLSVGMNVFGDGILTNTTISSINTGAGTIVISQAATQTKSVVILYMWTDATQMDGISGWEEYIIIDSAIKAQIKSEENISELKDQKNDMKIRIEGMAEGRDAGQAHHSTDAMNLNGASYGVYGLGIGNIRYRLTGSNLQFAQVSDSASMDGSFGGGW